MKTIDKLLKEQGEGLILISKKISKMKNLEEAKTLALAHVGGNGKLSQDIKNKHTVEEVVWTVSQTGLSLMGMKVF